jgi:SOS-response transcriptional repressor LexA
MNLKNLILRELSEGMSEKELASAVGVPQRTLVNILAGKDPKDRAIWKQFARYFRMEVDFLRAGESAVARRAVTISGEASHSAAGQMRKVPLLDWNQAGQMVTSKTLPGAIHAEAMIETTSVSGARTFALQVQDDSMEPLFGEGEMIFVNPDLKWGSGDYVLAKQRAGSPETMVLRQVKAIGSQHMLHPLNRKFEDFPLTIQEAVCGKVVRLRKNF